MITAVVESGTLRPGMILHDERSEHGRRGMRVLAIRRSVRHRAPAASRLGPTEELYEATVGPELLGVAVSGLDPVAGPPGPFLVAAPLPRSDPARPDRPDR